MQSHSHQLRVIRPDELEALWPTIQRLLALAIPHCNGEFEVDDLRDLVQQGRAFFMVLEDRGVIILAAVCEVIVTPRKKMLNVLALGGARLDMLALSFWGQVQDIGRLLGVDSVRGAVRPAMQRYYRRIAPEATVAYTILERTL